ncbi:hypothetical protein V6N13_107781 [Hibiscus sabdariffa]|uniref:MIP18 family-like domain-containing protein n=1 Tax=Hibiscus sabdariffa TaxID=183260 RepID=A0ABR2SR07_9ROSI
MLSKTTSEVIYVRVTFTPTVEHCSMATVIGLCLRVKLMRSLPSHYKLLIKLLLKLLMKLVIRCWPYVTDHTHKKTYHPFLQF